MHNGLIDYLIDNWELGYHGSVLEHLRDRPGRVAALALQMGDETRKEFLAAVLKTFPFSGEELHRYRIISEWGDDYGIHVGESACAAYHSFLAEIGEEPENPAGGMTFTRLAIEFPHRRD